MKTQHASQRKEPPKTPAQTESFGVLSSAVYSLTLNKRQHGQTTEIDNVKVWFVEPENMFSKCWYVGKYNLQIADYEVLSMHYSKKKAIREMKKYITI